MRNSLTHLAAVTLLLGRLDFAVAEWLSTAQSAVLTLRTDDYDGKGERRGGSIHMVRDAAGRW
jgi:hypothetical protein